MIKPNYLKLKPSDIVVAILPVVFGGAGLYIWGNTMLAMYGKMRLKSARFTPELSKELFIERSDLMQQFKMKYAGDSTLLVVGNHGTGKSTFVEYALHKEQPVLRAKTKNLSMEDIVSGLLRCVGVSSNDPLLVFEDVLVRAKGKCKKPLVIIDINDPVTNEELNKLLRYLKVLGYDRGLAKFVVVLSASVGSFKIDLPFTALRCNILNVPECSSEFAQQYLDLHLANSKLTAEEIKEVKQTVINTGFTSFLYLEMFVQFFKNFSDSNMDGIRSGIKDIDKRLGLIYSKSYNYYLKQLKVTSRSHKGFGALEKLASGERLIIDELAEKLGFEPQDLQKISLKYATHPVVFDIEEQTVYIENSGAQKVLKAELNRIVEQKGWTALSLLTLIHTPVIFYFFANLF